MVIALTGFLVTFVLCLHLGIKYLLPIMIDDDDDDEPVLGVIVVMLIVILACLSASIWFISIPIGLITYMVILFNKK